MFRLLNWLLIPGNETKGVLKYKMTGKEIIDFYHTYVEEEERGKGIGNLLAKVNCVCNILRSYFLFLQSTVMEFCLNLESAIDVHQMKNFNLSRVAMFSFLSVVSYYRDTRILVNNCFSLLTTYFGQILTTNFGICEIMNWLMNTM